MSRLRVIILILAFFSTVPAQGIRNRAERPQCDTVALRGLLMVLQEPVPQPLRLKPNEKIDTPTTVWRQENPEGNLEDFLAQEKVPPEAWKYYDRGTGEFRYSPDRTLELALENGDAELKALRMNWFDGFALTQLRDLTPVLLKHENLELWIVAGGKDFKTVRRAIKDLPQAARNRIRITSVKNEDIVNPWAQDGSKPLREPGNTAIPPVVSHRSHKGLPNNLLAVRALAKTRGVLAHQSLFEFDGGNVIVGEKNIFVGSEVLFRAMTRFEITRSEAIAALSAEFGKPVIEVGFTETTRIPPKQVDFHIDLTMAIARNHKTGREVVLVDSQKMGLKLLLNNRDAASLPADDRAFVEALIGEGQGHEHENLTAARLQDMAQNLKLKRFVEREQRLDHVARQMQQLGYEVVRVPGLADGRDTVVNYTNAIFSAKTAIISKTGFPVLDAAAQGIFKDLGYDTVEASVVQKSFCVAGGIRCLLETYRH